MPSSKPRRAPVNIDNDASIDFSCVAAKSLKPAVPTELLQQPAGTARAGAEAPALVAVDPRLNAYAHRPAPRRRAVFGGAPAVPVEGLSGPPRAEPEANSESKEQLETFWREDAARQEEEANETRRQKYEAQLKGFWAAASRPQSEPLRHHTHSFLEQFFADGVPDVEPWDLWALTMPRYGAAHIVPAACSSSLAMKGDGPLDRVHHPVLPESHYSRHYLHRAPERPAEVKLMPTKEELRAQRRERLRKEKEERDRAKRAAEMQKQQQQFQISTETSTVTVHTAAKDRLTNANIRFNLFSESVLNPLSTENKVFMQYQERFLEHQRRNYDRHVEAIPNQIKKRQRDLKRHAEENPLLRAYRIYPIYSAEHLGKLRNFANDGLLRGFVVWIARCDALLVLAGGEVAMRHIERWVLEKMRWGSTETTATRLLTCPLQDHETFSFSAKGKGKRQKTASGNGENTTEDGKEEEHQYVFMNFVDTVEEGEQFMRTMPTEGPWRDLTHIWRAAFAANTIPVG